MIHRYPIQLTTLEEDFRAIGLLPAKDTKEISETDNSAAPRDIPSPDPSTAAGNDDSQPTPARHKYAKQLKPKESPDDNNSYEPEDGGSQKGKGGGSYSPPRGGKESRVESEEGHVNAGYKLLKSKIMKKVKDTGQAPAVAQGLAPVKSIAGMKKEGANVSRAAELVSEVEALLNGSQMDEEFNGLVQGFDLISTNCSLLANRLVDIAEHYNVDKAITAMESLYNNAIEAKGILEDAAKAAEEDDDLDLESVKDAFRMMTLTLMDAVEAYDATISEMKKDDDDDDDDSDDDDDDDSDDDDDDDSDDDDDDSDDKGSIASRMSKLKAGKKGPFGK